MVPYTDNTSKKIFMVAMETFKNEIFVLSSFFCLNWYIICKNSEKKIFVRPNPEAPYAMIQHTEKIFWLLWRLPRPTYSFSARREDHKNI